MLVILRRQDCDARRARATHAASSTGEIGDGSRELASGETSSFPEEREARR